MTLGTSRLRAVAVPVLVGLAAGFTTLVTGAPQGIEGNPFRGRTLFVEKHCVQCHSVWGHGGSLGPEMLRVVAGKSLPQLAGAFWNHTPRMIEEMTGRGYAWPTIERQDMADLLSYLYYIRLFDDPGDPTRGSAIYTRLGCDFCHSLGGRGADTAPPLDTFSKYASSVPLAQAMWNAGPQMQPTQLGRGMPIPEFSGKEMVDIQAFIRERGIRRGSGTVEMLVLPDPGRGEALVQSKGCSACHETSRTGAPDLGRAALQMTVGEIGGVLWNHSYAMQDRMRAAGIRFPRLEDNNLADIISYLHFLGYQGRQGDPVRGASVFRDKGCATCHEGQLVQAPGLAAQHAGDDAIGLSAAMWNHAPQMHDVMAEHGVPWPRFDEGDMEDLVAYLRNLSREAKSSGH